METVQFRSNCEVYALMKIWLRIQIINFYLRNISSSYGKIMKTYLTALSKYMGAVDPLCKEILYTCIVCSRKEMLLPQKISHPWVCLCLLQSNIMYPCRVYCAVSIYEVGSNRGNYEMEVTYITSHTVYGLKSYVSQGRGSISKGGGRGTFHHFEWPSWGGV